MKTLALESRNFLKNKEFLLTAAVIILCLALSIIFPIKNNTENIIRGIFFLIIVPALYIKLVLKKNLREFGLNLKNRKIGLTWGSLMLILSSLIAYFLIKYTSFPANYKISSLAINNFWFFLFNLLVFYNLLLFVQEYFFRGFVLSALRAKFFFGAIFIQASIYFVIVLISSGGFHPEIWQLAPFIILSLTGGITAYKSRSIIYSWLSGLLFLLFLNAYFVYTLKTL